MSTTKQGKFWYWLPCRLAGYINVALPVWVIMYIASRYENNSVSAALIYLFGLPWFYRNIVVPVAISTPAITLIQLVYHMVLRIFPYKGVFVEQPRDIKALQYLYYIMFLPQAIGSVMLTLIMMFYFMDGFGFS